MENAKADSNITVEVAKVQKQSETDAQEPSGSKPVSPKPSPTKDEQDKQFNPLASSSGERVTSPVNKSLENVQNKGSDESNKNKNETATVIQAVNQPVIKSSPIDRKTSPVQFPNEAISAQPDVQPKEEIIEMQGLSGQAIEDAINRQAQKQRHIAFMDQGDTPQTPQRRRRYFDELESPEDIYDSTTIYKLGRKSKPGNIMLEVPGGVPPVESSDVQTEEVVFDEIEEDEERQTREKYATELAEAAAAADELASKKMSLGKIIKELMKRKNAKKEEEAKDDTFDSGISPYDYDPNLEDNGDYNLYTGMFADGIRRVDFVLVLRSSETLMAERTTLAFLMALVQAGIDLETEAGVLQEHEEVQFVKLYAADIVLDKFAGMYDVRRYFRNNHENFFNYRIYFMENYCQLKQEIDWIKSVRSHYTRPLQLSNMERSYIVYLLMRNLNPQSGHGLDRLLQKRIILDAFALHDGPYYCTPNQNFDSFNARQVLFLNWPGRRNIFKYQPLNMIHEYFGSKLAFYFVFYGFYNMALVFATLWAAVMSIAYALKDCEYFEYLRNYICHMRDVKIASDTVVTKVLRIVPNSAVCGECEGATSATACPITVIQDSCFDLKLMQHFDSPYIILYSVGLGVWALLFLAYWRRTECYWKWMWEEHRPRTQVLRFGALGLRPRRAPCGGWLRALRRAALDVALALVSLAVLCVLLFMVILYVHVEFTAPLAAKLVKVVRKRPGNFNDIVPPKINKLKEYGLLVLVTVVTLFSLNNIEKIIHFVSTWTTRLEGHRTYQKHEQSLILKYFTTSIVFGSCLIMYFAFVKGLFHSTPIAIWNVDINLTLPWKNYSVSMRDVSEFWQNVTQRALTLNCGAFRSRGPRRRRGAAPGPEPSTCEREYELHEVTHHEIAKNINTLMSQFAITLWFAPLFPWAPLFALLINIWDLRNKARVYVVRCRRVCLLRSAGIGAWNHVLRFICYAAPLFHALIIARTEIFKRYVFYKMQGPNITRGLERKFRAYMTKVNIEIYRISKTHSEFGQINQYRVSTDMASFNPSLFISASNRWVGVYQCRVDGFYELTKYSSGDGWPVQWNYFGENYSYAAPMPDHYYVKYLRVVFIIVYVHLAALVAVSLWQALRGCAGPFARYRQRQRVLRRLHSHRLNFIQRDRR
ncbi:anoctamin-4-like isoform X2 [Pectinophora gossypiella]|uniref:anoctamin-4-like isoform X2 n=1 Tax=Pectinophora gossypiella TaxID=13191 RepID=UPI00214E5D46|nr:anoctamin-4-like isoform X2 [Pectinophora gossypiella]